MDLLGIALSLTGPGASFIAFQQALLDLYDRGIILAINSANNEPDAMEVITSHPNMILKEKHFAARRMNWQNKVDNMRELARELNIGLDSMVFLDDNPSNRESMRHFLPEVETPELPTDPSEYVKFLHSLPYFASSAITDEDKMRGNMYVTERLRMALERESLDRDSFLASLGLEIVVWENDTSSLARLAQLTEKTNQFNTVKRPMSEEELADYIRDPKRRMLHARAGDKFGDHGIIALALVHSDGDNWDLESLLMSCRVLGRGVEQAFLSAIAKRAQDSGATTISAAFVPTEKNKPAKDFLESIWSTPKHLLAKLGTPSWVTVRYENV